MTSKTTQNNTQPIPQTVSESRKKTSKRFAFRCDQAELTAEEQPIPHKPSLDLATTDSILHLPLQSRLDQQPSIPVVEQNKAEQSRHAIRSMPPFSQDNQNAFYEQAVDQDYIQHFFQAVVTNKAPFQLQNLLNIQLEAQHQNTSRVEALLFLALQAILSRQDCFKYDQNAHRIQRSQRQSIEQSLGQWALLVLNSKANYQQNIEQKLYLTHLLAICGNNIESSVEMFLSNDDFNQAFILSNVTNRAFIQSDLYSTTKHMRRQFTIITQQSQQIMPKMAWPLVFSIVARFFHSKDIFQQISEMYLNSSKDIGRVLPCQLLLLVFQAQKQTEKEIVTKQDIMQILNIIATDDNRKMLDLVKLLYLLNTKKERFPQAFTLTVQSLLKIINHPSLLILTFQHSLCPISQLKDHLPFYIANNQRYLVDFAVKYQLQRQIQEMFGQVQNSNKLASQLHSWKQIQTLFSLQQQRQYVQFLKFYIQQQQQLLISSVVQHQEIMQSIQRVVTRFELACHYRRVNKLQYHSLLQKISGVLKEGNTLKIVKGCIAFIQLKHNIFILNDNNKVQALQCLKQYLTSNNNNMFLQHLIITIKKVLLTSDGLILMKNIAKGKRKAERVSMAKVIAEDRIDEQQKKDAMISLLGLTGKDSEIKGIMIVELLAQ